MSDEIPMLSLIKKGTKKFPRVIVAKADEYRNCVYWTGSGWSSDEAEAVVFADVNAALWVYHDLMMESVGDRPCHRYVAPIYVEVYGGEPNLEDLRTWLEKAVRIVVDSVRHGHGPNGTVGVIILDAEKTRAV